MTFLPVEWILVIYYGKSAHRAIYGRLPREPKYSKDYIQLSRRPEFIDALEKAFPTLTSSENPFIPIIYSWPSGSAPGKLFRQSADRPHLAWETNSAPSPWKMIEHPTDLSIESIPGNPSHRTADAADGEYEQLTSANLGQPYLIAVKLRNEDATLHLRVLADRPHEKLTWADLNNAPEEIRDLTAETSEHSALAWRLFSPGVGSDILCFDPGLKADPWSYGYTPTDEHPEVNTTEQLLASAPSPAKLESLQPSEFDIDSLAEDLPYSEDLISEFERRIRSGGYSVPNSTATVRTRGSAQRVFANEVKENYNWRCALSGIQSREFLVASHIVPWSIDETIRLDPSNGICLSVLIDRAFEKGFLIVQDDLKVIVNWEKIGGDEELRRQLGRYEGIQLDSPTTSPPKVDYLRRRRDL